jgi:hypothetical protein
MELSAPADAKPAGSVVQQIEIATTVQTVSWLYACCTSRASSYLAEGSVRRPIALSEVPRQNAKNRSRTQFIRYFFTEGDKHFAKIQQDIEESSPPYDVTPPEYDPEYREPPFLDQWTDADTACKVFAASCVSLLSDSLKLYFNTLQRNVIGFTIAKEKGEGFVPAFKRALGEILDTDWSDCPSDFGVIEQIALARNRGQHSENITMGPARHDAYTLRKYPRPFFASEDEYTSWVQYDGDANSFLVPSVIVTQETLFAAVEQVEKLAVYIDSRMGKAWEWRKKTRE